MVKIISLPPYPPRFSNGRSAPIESLQNERASFGTSSAPNGSNIFSIQGSKEISDLLNPPKSLTQINTTIGGDSVGEFQALSDSGQSLAESGNVFSLEIKDDIASVTVDNGNRQNDFKVLINLSEFADLKEGEVLSVAPYPIGPSQYGGENYAPKVTVTKTTHEQIHIEADYSSEQIDNLLNQLKTLNGNHNITGAPNPSHQHIESALEKLRNGNAHTNDINVVETMFQRLNEGYQTRSIDVSTKLLTFASNFLEGVNDSVTTQAFTHDADASSSAIQKAIQKGTDVLQGQANRVKSSAESLIDALTEARKIDLPIDKILNKFNEGFRSIDRNVPPLSIGENPTDAQVDQAIEQVHNLINQKQEAFFKNGNQEVSSAYAQLSGQLSSEYTEELLNGLNTALSVVSGVAGLAGLAKSMMGSVRALNKTRSSFLKAQVSQAEANTVFTKSSNQVSKNARHIQKLNDKLDDLPELDPNVIPLRQRISQKIDALKKEQPALIQKVQADNVALRKANKEVEDKTITLAHDKALQYFDRVNNPIATGSGSVTSISVMYNRYRSGAESEASIPSVPQLAPDQAGLEEAKFYKTVADNAYNLVSQQVSGDRVYGQTVYTEYHGGASDTYWTYYDADPSASFNQKVNELKREATKLNDQEIRNDPDSNTRWVVVSNRVGRTANEPYNVTFIMEVDKSQLPPGGPDGEPRLLIGNNTTVLDEFGSRSYGDFSEAEKGRIKNSWSSTYFPTGVTELYANQQSAGYNPNNLKNDRVTVTGA
ncbi:hypothetical protein AB4251_18365 [Vibrio lentus]|uniref:Uncharacterized protein n=1 Tax=Vibrio lentus TaxID=136468 RepID=A0AB36XGM9_9VIBR|nr:hypothetical protein [Vibrio lentus]MCC4839668.1 hypothetical protein [Vibrio lentus]PMI13238.1 hypothetical protein BCU51_22635 [Vibrio lentus]PMK31799.1 hypothetical protein BCU02_25235 [Vibrio lentus]PMK41961.1 hypothetical protein BCT99_07080 [Vibrio lentus]PML30638.1 hypothetical protein BCT79_21025 [Vibrio lentus]